MEEEYLFNRLKQGDREAFTLLFRRYYKDLVLFGGTFLPDKVACEDIVQSLFLKLWNDRKSLYIEKSLKSFLLRSVRNSCLDEIRHRHVVQEHENYVTKYALLYEVDTEEYLLYSDLYGQLQQALDKMPREYKEAFEMNRIEGLKYHEIANELQVSQRTVEVRISKAIQFLKKELKDFLPLLLLLGVS
ncbi:RNA polymerase sigma-70 factor [Parabacteroides sp. OttesenSCG-928-K15]|nr:RNA polymerase sigma-70 factor [Parabacteroides sp. OttesenSCG-928-K15]